MLPDVRRWPYHQPNLLRLVLISVSWESRGATYYRINEEGRAALADPEYIPIILRPRQ